MHLLRNIITTGHSQPTNRLIVSGIFEWPAKRKLITLINNFKQNIKALLTFIYSGDLINLGLFVVEW